MREVLTTDRQSLDRDYAGLVGKTVNGVSLGQLRFSIMHGNGNVIVVVDEARSGLADLQVDGALGRAVCESFRAVQIDGIAFLRRNGGQVKMTYFERDGTHSQMCGNALRCLTRYCQDRGYLPSEAVIATDDGDKWVGTADGVIRVALGPGREFRKVTHDQYFVFSGLPHLVVLVDDLDSIDVKTAGAALRYDEALCLLLEHPEGLHVDFMRQRPDGVSIRTYEVGSEDETLACGTGVAGSAFVANMVWGLSFPVPVFTRGGLMTVEDGESGLVISGVTDYLLSTIDD